MLAASRAAGMRGEQLRPVRASWESPPSAKGVVSATCAYLPVLQGRLWARGTAESLAGCELA